MSLVTITSMLDRARKDQYAVGAFDVSNHDMALAVIEVAEELSSPVILMGLGVDLAGDRLDYWLPGIRRMAERATVPVCIHLDHATDLEFIRHCVDMGFTSVMFDGSTLPLEENIRRTQAVTAYAHTFGVSVEAELGHVGDGIVGNSETGKVRRDGFDKPEDFLTNPEELAHFVEATQLDCIAVAVGTAHGIYVYEPKIDFVRLAELQQAATVPMVMHGGSGTPDDLIRKSVAHGICKLNIFSEMLAAFYGSMKTELNAAEHLAIWPHTANEKPIQALQAVVRQKMQLLGSVGRA